MLFVLISLLDFSLVCCYYAVLVVLIIVDGVLTLLNLIVYY